MELKPTNKYMIKTNLSLNHANFITLSRVHLLERLALNQILEVIDDTVGVHASRYKSLAFFFTSRNYISSIEDTLSDFYQSNETIKLRCMRGTLHIATLRKAAIYHKATLLPRLRTCSYLRNRIGVSDYSYKYIRDYVSESVIDEPRSIENLQNNIRYKGTDFSSSLRIVVRTLWEEGFLCCLNKSIDWNHEERLYGLLSSQYPTLDLDSLDIEIAQDLLIKNYFESYGPATISDAAWWSGLPESCIKRTLSTYKDEFLEVTIEDWDDTFIMSHYGRKELSESDGYQESIRLLTYEDNLLKAYKKSRKRFVQPHLQSQVYNCAGEAKPTIILNGRVIGTWDFEPYSRIIRVTILNDLDNRTKDLIVEEVEYLSSVFDRHEKVKVNFLGK